MKILLFIIIVYASIIGYKALFSFKDINYQPKTKLVESILILILVCILMAISTWIVVVFYTIFNWLNDIEKSRIKLAHLFPWSDVLIVITLYLIIYFSILQINKHLSRSILRAYNRGVRDGVSTAFDTRKWFCKDEDREELERLEAKIRQNLLLNEDAFVSSDKPLSDRDWKYDNLMKKSHPEYFEDFYDKST